MIVLPLGISSTTPTPSRHQPCTIVWRNGEVYLFDCGENVSMRMLQAGLKRSRISYIFISHLHADHIGGLFGLLTTMNHKKRSKPLIIYGTKGIKNFVYNALDACNIKLLYEIEIHEFEESFESDVIVDDTEIRVEAKKMDHQSLCVGYRLTQKEHQVRINKEKIEEYNITNDEDFSQIRKGEDIKLPDGKVIKNEDLVIPSKPEKSIAYITDTRPCENAIELGRDTSVMIVESTFRDDARERAHEAGHCTSVQAAEMAKKANTKLLLLTHFSSRYTNLRKLLNEANTVFEAVYIATEMRPIYVADVCEKHIINPKVHILNTNNSKVSKSHVKKKMAKKGIKKQYAVYRNKPKHKKRRRMPPNDSPYRKVHF